MVTAFTLAPRNVTDCDRCRGFTQKVTRIGKVNSILPILPRNSNLMFAHDL
jgi:hypothetical protein